ncbi:uncharacterized protein LOC113549746 [Rhopalosiphum maidis]|uniref:uncharacterized protein LOC113549746 n=1 Tax=Rhopalosiphum maidis TaxID=43146 RepID=UPI000EFF414F|nr:uncharacterized protein LOC113549746 [Rhopalosiphum maidis]
MFTDNHNFDSLAKSNVVGYVDLVSSDDSVDDMESDITRLNTNYTQSSIVATQSLTNNLSINPYNNQIEMHTLSKPTIINLEKTIKTHPNKGKMLKKALFPKKKTNTTPALWISTNYNRGRNQGPRYKINSKCVKKLKSLEQKNSKLTLKIKQLTIKKQELQDIQIKYLELKEKVLETEEKLLIKGIDTSEYSAFSLANEDQDIPITNDTKYDVLLEYKLERENQIPDNHIFTHGRSITLEPRNIN